MADEKVLPTLERRRKHAKIKERQKQRELEEKAQKVRVIHRRELWNCYYLVVVICQHVMMHRP